MKRILLAAAALATLVTVAAFAQSGPGMMQKGPMSSGQMGQGGMMGQMGQGGMMGGMMGGGMQHGQSGAHGTTAHQGDRSASSLAFAAVNTKMHEDMNIAYTGDADADFIRGMIPHHQGAIDMAKIVLAFGKNPEVRKLAEEIIKAQEGEIATMRDWLKKNGKS